MADILKPKKTPFVPTEAQLEKSLKQNYLAAWNETRSLIAEIYEKHAAGGSLSRTDMVKFNRLNKTESKLSEILGGLYKRNKKFLDENLQTTFLAGHFQQIYELEMSSEILLGFGGVNKKAIEQMLSSSLTGLTLNERLKKNEREIVAKIRQELAQSLVQGESYQTAAKRFKGALEGDLGKAVRIAWTETHRAEEEAANLVREKARERLNFEEVWLSTLDGKTRRTHRRMDGKTKDAEGFFDVNGNKARFPGDPRLPAKEVVHCRCTSVVRFPDRPITERRGRISLDPEVRQNNGLFPGDMTYDKWYQSRMVDGEKFVAGAAAAVSAETIAANEAAAALAREEAARIAAEKAARDAQEEAERAAAAAEKARVDAVKAAEKAEKAAARAAAKAAKEAAKAAKVVGHPKVEGRELSFDELSVIKDFRKYNTGENDWYEYEFLYSDQLEQSDGFLAEVYEEQKFDGLPEVISEKELAARIWDEGYIPMMRGLSDKRFVEQFKRGNYFAGLGIYGNGTYAATAGEAMLKELRGYSSNADEFLAAIQDGYAGEVARDYAGPAANDGGVMTMALKPNSKIIEKNDIEAMLYNELRGKTDPFEQKVLNDLGRFAAMKGYDAIYVKNRDYYVVLNRTAVVVGE